MDREKTPWLIVLMHAPMYSSNVVHYMEGESMRAVFESWFVNSKVDIIFAGHVHAYERSVCLFIHLFFSIFNSNIQSFILSIAEWNQLIKEQKKLLSYCISFRGIPELKGQE